MRPFKPAPKNASANRIRERYLHQLGLQRGAGAPLTAPHCQSNHVVVISGLPSLPEDRATTEHVMESHDFSISRHSQHTGGTPGSVDANSCGENDDMESDSGSAHGGAASLNAHFDTHSHCSKSTLSVSPNNVAGETLTSMALAYPTGLRKVPPPSKATCPPNNNTGPFSLSHSVPWRTTSLSKPASVLLDNNDHDSVSSAGTSTTAESSLPSAMMSRDWGATPHPSSAGVSISSQGGESPLSAPGVYFQCGHPRLLGGNGAPSIVGSGHCATSSLAHALNRFNIDSDCEASVASNSIVEDHMLMDEDEDESIFDDTASRTSVTSHTSAGSTKSSQHQQLSTPHRAALRKKKIGKTQRLMDRAAAHERILQIRTHQSQKMRASLVHSQRMSHHHVSISGLFEGMAQELSESSCSTSSASQASIPLVHVQHGSSSSSTPRGRESFSHQTMGDLGRTPTASNCSDLRKLQQLGSCPSQFLYTLPVDVTLPVGVHVISANRQCKTNLQRVAAPAAAPLGFHPQLASRIPTPPPKLVASLPSVRKVSSVSEVESREVEESKSLQYMNHPATMDDVMEVAMTLSKLGERTGSVPRRTGSIPRIR
mmetsp:Transcript_42096/g.75944  ORF Transcript_42096/g.75944 Transcript_42096/m.75944 type:complete len:599 (-) Transcript_42096:57-1853(-)